MRNDSMLQVRELDKLPRFERQEALQMQNNRLSQQRRMEEGQVPRLQSPDWTIDIGGGTREMKKEGMMENHLGDGFNCVECVFQDGCYLKTKGNENGGSRN